MNVNPLLLALPVVFVAAIVVVPVALAALADGLGLHALPQDRRLLLLGCILRESIHNSISLLPLQNTILKYYPVAATFYLDRFIPHIDLNILLIGEKMRSKPYNYSEKYKTGVSELLHKYNK